VPLVAPFRALRFDPAVVGSLTSVTAPPYDVVDEQRRQQLLDASPWSVVHLDLADGHGDPEHDESRYARAASRLKEWRRTGVVRPDAEPAYWAYEMTRPPVAIRGVICAMALEPWGASVLPHERTMPGPIDDRLALLRALRTHLSPIYGTVAGPVEPLRRLLDEVVATTAAGEVVDPDGVQHRLWPVDARVPVAGWLADLPLLIADGHHRYETALRYREERRRLDGPGGWDRVPTLIVDAAVQDVPVLPFHRVVTGRTADFEGEPVSDALEALAGLRDDDVSAIAVTRGDTGPEARLVRLPGSPPTVRALHDTALRGVPADTIAYTSDASDAVSRVVDGQSELAVLLPPTSPAAIRSVVAAGERLPPKSTLFWPKPRTGMVMMGLDEGGTGSGAAPRDAPARSEGGPAG
jgi:uncharacterized protein (DUF1015 family)